MEWTFPPLLYIHRRPFSCLRRTWRDGVIGVRQTGSGEHVFNQHVCGFRMQCITVHSQQYSTLIYLKVDNLKVVKSLRLRTRHNELKAIWEYGAHHSYNTRNIIIIYRSDDSTQLPHHKLVGWLSGRTSVSDRRTFAGLHRTCSWWVTMYMGKPSAVGQPTGPTQPFILTVSINE